jgi:hypothetical protein
MKKTCDICETYWRVRNERKYDHPCIHRDPEKGEICSDFKIVWTQEACLRKYPRVVAHLICCSLGYFTPQSAANAISFYKHGQAFFCEWYSHMTKYAKDNLTGNYFDEAICKRVGKETLNLAFVGRHSHHGYMAEIKQAKHLVAAELKNKGCTSSMLASWF